MNPEFYAKAAQDRPSTAMGYETMQNAAPPKQRIPPMDRLYQSVDVLSKAASMTTDIAVALCGSEPQQDSAGQSIERGGMFGSIEDAAERINRLASSILADMSRINSRSAGA